MVGKKRLEEILNNFSNARIAVVGDVMLDDYIFGSVDRISPEAPVPVVNVNVLPPPKETTAALAVVTVA